MRLPFILGRRLYLMWDEMNSGYNDRNVAAFSFSEGLANRGTLARFQRLKNTPTGKEVILIVRPKTRTKKPILINSLVAIKDGN